MVSPDGRRLPRRRPGRRQRPRTREAHLPPHAPALVSRLPPLVTTVFPIAVEFKGAGVVGVEVTFLVVTFGSTETRVGLAAAAAADAVVLVVAVGLAVRGRLERVPENALKFVVGVLLTSFGVFWGGEGAGVEWPGGDVAILGIIGFLGLVSFALTRQLRRQRVAVQPA